MSQVRAVRIVQVAKNIDRALHCAAGRAVRDWAPPSGTRGYISTPGPSLVGGAGPSAVAPPTQKGSCTLAALGADYSLSARYCPMETCVGAKNSFCAFPRFFAMLIATSASSLRLQ